jgi:K(+)-stimulated pyrophosphate-energized sodium pump
MNTNTSSNSGYGFLHWLVAAILAIALIGLWLLGYGPGGSKCSPTAAVVAAPAAVVAAPATVVAVAPAAAPAPVAPAAVAPIAAVEYKRVVSVPAAKVYFGLDKTDLPVETDKTLAEVTSYLKANSSARAYISGFHDPSGSVARNEDLAKNRAKGVAQNLEKLGITKEQIVMQKPSVTTGTGEAKEARRVEVSVWANQ